MTENEKLEEFIKMMKDSNQMTDVQESQLRMFLSTPIDEVKILIPRGSLPKRPICIDTSTQVEIYHKLIHQHFGLPEKQLGYQPKLTIIDDMISQSKHAL